MAAKERNHYKCMFHKSWLHKKRGESYFIYSTYQTPVKNKPREGQWVEYRESRVRYK